MQTQRKPLKRIFAADFEATTDPNDCRVWIWGIANVDTPEKVMHGNSIQSFLSYVSFRNSTVYFHNLKYDGHFIIDWLLNNGYVHIETDNALLRPMEFKTLISDNNKFFSITVRWKSGRQTEFRDSYKKLPMSLKVVGKSFNLDVVKGEIDYKAFRPKNHKPTAEELEYLYNDVYILAKAIQEVHDSGMKKLTLPSDSLAEYKRLVGSKLFMRTFPTLPELMDTDIRRAYRGGFTYADTRFAGRVVGEGLVLDVNSLYPFVMRDRLLPYGEPEYSDGYVKPTATHPLTIFTVTFTAKLKKDHIPCIQVKNSFRYAPTQYQKEIKEPTTLAFTSVDWDLINEHYDVTVLEYLGGYRFQATTGLFDQYVDKWSEVKANSTGGKRAIAKLHLNALYGKFATNPNVTSKVPYLDEDGAVRFRRGQDAQKSPVYTAAGVFITAYARDLTIRAAQSNYLHFAYADTDSLHLLVNSAPTDLDIHPSKLGAWKHEYDFAEALYVRPKVYLEKHHDGTYTNAFAGLPEKVSSTLTFSDIIDGARIPGKLSPKSVPGGVVLEDVMFTLNL